MKTKLRVEVGSCEQQYGFMPKKYYYECSAGFEVVDEKKPKKVRGTYIVLLV